MGHSPKMRNEDQVHRWLGKPKKNGIFWEILTKGGTRAKPVGHQYYDHPWYMMIAIGSMVNQTDWNLCRRPSSVPRSGRRSWRCRPWRMTEGGTTSPPRIGLEREMFEVCLPSNPPPMHMKWWKNKFFIDFYFRIQNKQNSFIHSSLQERYHVTVFGLYGIHSLFHWS